MGKGIRRHKEMSQNRCPFCNSRDENVDVQNTCHNRKLLVVVFYINGSIYHKNTVKIK